MAPGYAGQTLHDYDAQGRLIRTVDEQGRVSQYIYDAAGNLLQVVTDGTAQAPTLSSFTPSSLRRGETKQAQADGTGFTGVSLTASDSGLTVSNVQVAPTRVTFTLMASASANLGAHALTFSNSLGSATASVRVDAPIPKVSVAPTPLAIPPDNSGRQFTVQLSAADAIDHSFALSTDDPAIATVSPASFAIAAGETTARPTVTGKTTGQTRIRLSSTTLGDFVVPVFVTGEFAGINSSIASLVGVRKIEPENPGQTSTPTSVVSRSVGITFGNFVREITPKSLQVNSGPTPLTISGEGLQGADSIELIPPEGLTLGALSVNPEGTVVTVPISVAADAPTTPRQLLLKAGGVAYPVLTPSGNRLLITLPTPQIISISPLYATPGTSGSTLTVRGRNLQGAQSVAITPSNGIVVAASPSVSADGTQLTTSITLSPTTPLGEKLVQVASPAGASSATLEAANTLTVVNEINETFTPIQAAMVGIVVQSVTTPTSIASTIPSSPVGIALGSVIRSITPNSGIIGESVNLVISGAALQDVTSVQLTPGTGLTVGAAVVAGDGSSVTVPVQIASDAPRTFRTVVVRAGSSSVPFASAASSLFQVTAMVPRIDSVDPLYLQTGAAPVQLTVRGVNLQNATQVKVTPATGLMIGATPTSNPSGTIVTLNVSADANAATGNRLVTVVTPAGETSSVATSANTIRVTSEVRDRFTPIIAPNVGVLLAQPPQPPVEIIVGPFAADTVGVRVEQVIEPVPVARSVRSNLLGVSLGAAGRSIAPPRFVRGASGTLVVNGNELTGVTSVSVNPSTGITLGSPAISPDGSSISIPISVAASAPITLREVVLNTASGRIAFSNPAASLLYIAPGEPRIDSITPILANQGDTVTMTIRGANFQNATAVSITPGPGVSISSTRTVNANGTELVVGVSVAADAPPGSHVIRVHVLDGASSAVAEPANTFTVFPK